MMRFQFIQAYTLALLLIQASFCQIHPGNMIDIPGGTFTMGNNNPPPGPGGGTTPGRG